MNFAIVGAVQCVPIVWIVVYPSPMQTPEVDIALPEGGLKLHDPATIQASFKNPLGKKLTNGKFFLHGDGIVADTSTDVGYGSTAC